MAQRVREAAVMCWFPANKKEPIPVSAKFMDDNNGLISVKDIRILETISIMQGKEFKCEAEVNDRMIRFTLTFFSGICRWMLSI